MHYAATAKLQSPAACIDSELCYRSRLLNRLPSIANVAASPTTPGSCSSSESEMSHTPSSEIRDSSDGLKGRVCPRRGLHPDAMVEERPLASTSQLPPTPNSLSASPPPQPRSKRAPDHEPKKRKPRWLRNGVVVGRLRYEPSVPWRLLADICRTQTDVRAEQRGGGRAGAASPCRDQHRSPDQLY